jgi:3-oxoacyl-(acyl-carrier-protein) synthase
MTAITGIGWIAEAEYGCVRRQLRRPYSDMKSLRSKLQDDSVFLYPVKSFGKYDRVSQMACCVAALAFYDAEMSYSESRKQDIGILGTNSDGCLQSNLDFFEDFVRNGRTLGRANLFVYTLPSIPVAEAAIYFKCQGPLLYMTFPKAPVASMLRHADRMIVRGESRAMLAVMASEEEAQCFVLKRSDDVSGEPISAVEEAIEIGERMIPLEEMIEALTKA